MKVEKFPKGYDRFIWDGDFLSLKEEKSYFPVLKYGTANSGNRGHSGRPGHIGGSGSGSGETSSLFDKSDQEITDIESEQGALNKDVFQRQLVVDDFMPGGKYEEITYTQLDMSQQDLTDPYNRKIIADQVYASNAQVEGGGISPYLALANKFDSQNALYDKLKDNKDFNELVKNYDYSSHSSQDLEVINTDEDQRRLVIRDLVDQWSSTSGDTDPKAVAMQIAANGLFGEGKVDHLTGGISQKRDDMILEYELKFNPGRKAFLQAQYNATQDYLKKNNIKELILYRGHEGKRSKLDGGDDVEVNLQPLSSFSMSANIAVGFAVSAANGQYDKTKPSVIASIVPAKRIFALPNTGIGCTGEREVVVLGGKMKATVIAGHLKIGDAFGQNSDALDPQTLSAVDFKRNLTSMLHPSSSTYPALSALLEGKAPKKEIPNLDEDLENADWTKRTWDLPAFGTPKFDEFLSASGMTLDHFKKLPVYKWAVESDLIKEKSISHFPILVKGGPGSGNWDGPGDPRFAHEGETKPNIEKTILKYQNGAYQSINGSLRGEKINDALKPTIDAHIQALDDAMTPSTSDKYLFRGDGAGISATLFDVIPNLPNSASVDDVFFGQIEGKSYNEFFTEKLKGMEFTDKAFLSASTSQRVALDKFVPGTSSFSKFGASGLVEIKVPKGTKMLDVEKVSMMGAKEKEIILARGSRLRIDRVSFEPLQEHDSSTPRFYIRWKTTLVTGISEEKSARASKKSSEKTDRFIWNPGDITVHNSSKSLGLSTIFKGGPGSGSWNGPGDPRFAHEITVKEKMDMIDEVVEFISDDEIRAVQDYTQHAGINKRLRESNDLDDLGDDDYDQLESLDKAFDKVPQLNSDITVYRGIEKLDFIPDTGGEFNDKGYVSTCISMEGFNRIKKDMAFVHMEQHSVEIRIPKGSKILPLQGKLGSGEFDYQDEGLLPRNTRFKVIKKTLESAILEVIH